MLGSYHPLVADNAARLVRLSGMDEVSFHMSGTEAVMQAVRLARSHTRRSHLVQKQAREPTRSRFTAAVSRPAAG